ncbi:MAG: ribokinase [Cyanobacteria bacterium J06621_15]
MSIIVFGSINMDLVATAPHLPTAGETLLGYDFFQAPGGKGANQAVAIAKLGIPIQIVGRVGKQGFGQELIDNLEANGVKTDNVFLDESVSSGVAIINVDDAGENQIVVIPGANGQVNQSDVGRLSQLLPGKKALLLQLEIPVPTVIAAAEAAQKAGVKVILDPAPAQKDLPAELYPLIDILTPNQVEAGQLVGFPVNEEDSARKAAEVLLEKGVKSAVIKLGAKGVYYQGATESFFTPAFSVKTVDTTAAGDAFNGGLAAALSQELSLKQAIVWGSAAGALAATKSGAQFSLPDKDTFDKFLASQNW